MLLFQCFEKQTGYLFKDVPRTYLHGLSKYVVPNEALILTKHFAMLPYIAVMQKDSDILRSFVFDDEVSSLHVVKYKFILYKGWIKSNGNSLIFLTWLYLQGYNIYSRSPLIYHIFLNVSNKNGRGDRVALT